MRVIHKRSRVDDGCALPAWATFCIVRLADNRIMANGSDETRLRLSPLLDSGGFVVMRAADWRATGAP